MTYSKTAIIYCDGETEDGHSCAAMYGNQLGLPTATQVRGLAAGEGWTYDGGDDYCPECSGNAEGKA
ncbi:hypothetical protein ACFQDD_00535 [Halorubrum pallidum]|uniref:Uncharacterized protein n=1 Tax=Halorubrum pallidum TaxID=1526114 RepID=A0ABD5SXT0_9EURY